jgi:ribosomal protein S27AE
MQRTYLYTFVCPRCGQTSEFTAEDNKQSPPRVSCGECLMSATEVVELKVLKVDITGAK